jgi:polyphosphate kinase
LIFKTNSLSDEPIIEALYAAAQAGVKIDLIVRGVCCLRPGVPGVSETVRVISVIGRFLEHSRIYYFHNGGRFEIFMGSADLMRRNLDRRVEVLFPIADPILKRKVRDEVLEVYLHDTEDAHELSRNGAYHRVLPAAKAEPMSAQLHFVEERVQTSLKV